LAGLTGLVRDILAMNSVPCRVGELKMIRSREVFSPMLEHALVANRVLASLKKNQMDEELRQALEDAILFLQRMLQGQKIVTSMTISDNSYHDALAYEEGIKAFDLSSPDEADPDSRRVIGELEKTASEIRDGKDVDAAARSRLQDFFSAVRQVALRAESKPLEETTYSET
jgi:hypothetical protein